MTSSSEKKDPKFSGFKILIVDKEPEIRTLMRNVLEGLGVRQIAEEPDGKKALRFIKSNPELVDLVICDWNMPKHGGLEFLSQLRTSYPDIPFMLVSGRADKDAILEAKAAGVRAFVRKPFSRNELETKLKTFLPGSMPPSEMIIHH